MKQRFSKLRHLLRLVLLLPLLFLTTGCYLINQGTRFMGYQLQARNLEGAEAESPEYARLFEEARRVRRFGEQLLGLEATRNYTTFVEIDRDYLVSVVSAARPTSFERKLWRFPIVGTVPYRGYYSPKGAERMAERLREQGWETVVRRVDAFSTLGFFRDPLYSFMADYHVERLANLILHEMTHATVWIADDAPLNEAMATFVGDRGALEYLAYRYGRESEIYREGVARQQERRRLVGFMRELASRLEELYDREGREDELLRRKEAIIREEQERFVRNYEQWFSTDRYRFIAQIEINNAYVDLFRTYNDDVELFEELYRRLRGDMRRLLDTLEELEASEEPRRALLELLASGKW